MTGVWQTANQITARIDDMVASMGDDAFPHNGRAHLYSGPSRIVQKRIGDFSSHNHARAVRRAKIQNAILIDDTPIGQFLEKFEDVGVYKYFELHPNLNREQRIKEADEVWRHASRRFIESLWGDVYTTVCGADRGRIYYQEEIPTVAARIPEMIAALLKSKDIETINQLPIDTVRKLYKPDDYDDVQRLISLSEQKLDLRTAWQLGSSEVFSDYLIGQEQYRVDRHDVLNDRRSIYARGPHQRLAHKQNRLRRFVTNQMLCQMPISASVPEPHLPSAIVAGGHGRLVAGMNKM